MDTKKTVIPSDTIVGIDVGTTKICTVVAGIERDSGLTLFGVGRVPSRGLHKGKVVDLEGTISSIRESKLQAEQAAGVDIESAFVSVTGSHIKAIQSNAIVMIADPQRGITIEDTEHALDLAQRVEIPNNRRLIDVRVQEYIVDGKVGISDPIGMTGMRLEVNVLLITAAVAQLENIYRAVNHAGIDVENIILEPIASAMAVLSPDERASGVALIDIGGGTTDLAVYRDNGLAHLAIWPVGGDHFDSDLAYGIDISRRQAEHLKIKLGGVGREYKNSDDIIEITKSGSDRKEALPLKIIAEIITPRLEEILDIVHREIKTAGLMNEIPSGVVITGGTSLLPGITEMASSIFGLQARRGYPRGIEGIPDDIRNPIYSTAVGLVIIGAMDYANKDIPKSHLPVNKTLETIQLWGKSVMKLIFK